MKRIRVVLPIYNETQLWTWDGEIVSVLAFGGQRWLPYPKECSKDIWDALTNDSCESDVEVEYI